MSKTDNRLRLRSASNNSGLSSATAPSTAAVCRKSPQQKGQQQSLDAIASQSAVGYVSEGEIKRLSHKSIYPTLKLRFGLNHADAWEEARQYAGRSKSFAVQKPLKAVTLPRRIPTSIGSTNSLNVRDSNSTGSTTKRAQSASACLPSGGCKDELQRRQRLARLNNRLTFEQWLMVKRKQEEQLKRQLQHENDLLMHQLHVRKEMSDRCYENWLSAKQQRGTTGGMQQATARLANQYIDQARREETQRCLEQWEKRKLLELQRRREIRMYEEQNAKTCNQLRQHLSQLAWQRWLAQTEAKEAGHNIYLSPVNQQQRHTMPYPWPQYECRKQQRKLQHQLHNLYLHVPLSAAQRALQQRLNSMASVGLQRKKKLTEI